MSNISQLLLKSLFYLTSGQLEIKYFFLCIVQLLRDVITIVIAAIIIGSIAAIVVVVAAVVIRGRVAKIFSSKSRVSASQTENLRQLHANAVVCKNTSCLAIVAHPPATSLQIIVSSLSR